MRKLALGLALSLLLIALIPHPASALSGERGSGHGVDQYGTRFNFRAVGYGTGFDATGNFRIVGPSYTLAGDVECLDVMTSVGDHLGKIIGLITRASDPVYIGLRVVIDVVDGLNVSDGVGFEFFLATFCPQAELEFPGALMSGRVTLVDA